MNVSTQHTWVGKYQSLATVLKADRIVVIYHGKIIAAGSHQELLEQKGLYARLAALQFGDVD